MALRVRTSCGRGEMSDWPAVVSLALGDNVGAWEALGFTVADGVVSLGGLRLLLGAPGEGVVSWAVSGIEPVVSLDGLVTEVVAPSSPAAGTHENGAVGVDHVVALTPEFDRTAGTFAAAGMELRRTRTVGSGADAFRQGFRRMGPTIIELVEGVTLPPGPCRFWGLTLIATDLDGFSERLGPELVSAPKPAVQPGRRICTVRQGAGLGQPVAIMDPEPPR